MVKSGTPEWILFETFGSASPTIIYMNRRIDKFAPVKDRIKARGAAESVRAVWSELAAGRDEIHAEAGDRSVHAHALRVDGQLHGFWYWSGRSTPPQRPRAGAWWINLTTLMALGSPEWAEMAQIPEDQRGAPRSVGAMFGQVSIDEKQAVAMKKIISGAAGTVHQGVWTVNREDDSGWLASFWCRILEERGESSDETERIARGLSVDTGDVPKELPSAEPLVVLEHRLLEATRDPGTYRALLNVSSLRLIRWVGEDDAAPPEIAWMGASNEPKPEIHHEDRARMWEMVEELRTSSPRAQLRVRGLHKPWITIDVLARLVAIDQETTAVLAEIQILDTAE